MTPTTEHTVELLTRAGCSLCDEGVDRPGSGCPASSVSSLSATDVDAAASAGDPTLRAEYGDLLPVVLLDGVQHSYWEVDEAGLRADLTVR